MPEYEVEITPLSALTTKSHRDWHLLSEQTVEPNPFFAPQVLLPAARWLKGGASVHLALVRRKSQPLLAMPVTSGRYRRLPLTAALTWRHAHRFVGTPLLHPEGILDAPSALLRALAKWQGATWLVLEQCYLDGPVAEAFRAAAAAHPATWVEHMVWHRPAVYRRDSETYLQNTLSSKSAKELRRRRRNLERDHGTVASSNVAGGQDLLTLEAEVEAFLAMESAGWKGRAGTALANVPGHGHFWRELCRAMAEEGRLELWQLRAGGSVAARQCHIRDGDTIFHLKTTYDEALGRYSPGVQLELDVLHAFHLDSALRLIDPCTEREPGTSSRLYPDTRRIGDALVGLTARGRVAARLTPVIGALWRSLRRMRKPG